MRQYCTKLRWEEVAQLPWVDRDTNNQLLAAMPNPIGYMWEENYPPHGPPGWDPNIFWPWENVRFLLTFFPARMRTAPDRAVVLMYKPANQPLPMVNPLGLRPVSLQCLMGWCCGPSRADACPIGERLVGCCAHCAAALSFTAVVPGDPTAFSMTHRGYHVLDRRKPIQMDMETTTEVS